MRTDRNEYGFHAAKLARPVVVGKVSERTQREAAKLRDMARAKARKAKREAVAGNALLAAVILGGVFYAGLALGLIGGAV